MVAKTLFLFIVSGTLAIFTVRWALKKYKRIYLKTHVAVKRRSTKLLLTVAILLIIATAWYYMHLKEYAVVYYGKQKGRDISFFYNCFPSEHFCKECETKKISDSTSVFKVAGYKRTDFPVSRGQVITLTPSNESRLYAGNFLTLFLGPFQPVGRKNGILYVPLHDYNQLREFPHAALLYRTLPSKPWMCVEEGVTFISDTDGYLEFNINDRILEDNKFHFCVTATYGENFSEE